VAKLPIVAASVTSGNEILDAFCLPAGPANRATWQFLGRLKTEIIVGNSDLPKNVEVLKAVEVLSVTGALPNFVTGGFFLR